MSYRGVTFNKQACKSEDDALIFHTFLNGCVGKVRGCDVTYDDTTVYIAPGYFMTYGRLVNVYGTEILTPEAIPTGTQFNCLVFTIDLSKENTAQIFKQGYFEFLSSYDGYPTVTQEDLFNGGNVYQIPIARFELTVNGIGKFKEEMGSVNINEVWKTLNQDLGQYREQFDEYFTEYRREFLDFFNTQEQVILEMIADLQEKDFVTNKVYDQKMESFNDMLFNGEVSVGLCDSDGEALATDDYEELSLVKKIKFY